MREGRPAQSGFINFPSGPHFKDTGEGGMFVRLVVVNNGEFMACCGGDNVVLYDESYIRDDNRPRTTPPEIKESMNRDEVLKATKEEARLIHEYDEYHFPRINDRKEKNDYLRVMSIPYLCAMTIGSTGRSMYHLTNEEYWYCTYDDLNDDGKLLYDQLKKLYPGCAIHIQTWLDT